MGQRKITREIEINKMKMQDTKITKNKNARHHN